MGPIGMPEMIMIFVVILLLFGAKKLPELAKGIGKSLGEFQKAKAEFEREIAKAAQPVEVKSQPDKVAHSVYPVAVASSSEQSENETSEPQPEISPAKS